MVAGETSLRLRGSLKTVIAPVAFLATIRAERQYSQHEKLEEPSPLGAAHIDAPAIRALA
jgi:hypothetical protein